MCFAFASHSQTSVTLPFNNMQNLKFKSPPMVVFFSRLSINVAAVFENEKNEFNGVKGSDTFFAVIGGFRSILKTSVLHGSLTQGKKVSTLIAMIGGFQSILLFL